MSRKADGSGALESAFLMAFAARETDSIAPPPGKISQGEDAGRKGLFLGGWFDGEEGGIGVHQVRVGRQ